MNIFNLLIGIGFTLIAAIITIIQIRERVYSEKKDFTWGNVQLTSAAILSYMFGIYMIILAF